MKEYSNKESAPDGGTKTNQKIYWELSLKHHPDLGGDTNVMKEINLAYEAAENGDDGALRELYRRHRIDSPEREGRRSRTPLTEEELRKKINAFQLLGKYEKAPKGVNWLMEYLLSVGEVTKERYGQYLNEQGRRK